MESDPRVSLPHGFCGERERESGGERDSAREKEIVRERDSERERE